MEEWANEENKNVRFRSYWNMLKLPDDRELVFQKKRLIFIGFLILASNQLNINCIPKKENLYFKVYSK